MILTAIAAMAKNRAIGKNNQLPWHLPEDLKFFKEKTKSRVLIMGRKTFESLGKPLPGRFHIVITRNQAYEYRGVNVDPEAAKMVEVVSSLKNAIELAHMITTKFKQRFGDEVFIVGGAEIYAQSLDVINRLYLTVIDQEVVGDAFFPEFDEKEFHLVEKIDRPGPPSFSFCTYER